MGDTPEWALALSAAARRDLAQLPESAAGAVIEVFGAIAGNPHRLGKPLSLELEGLWSARRGPYRVVYEIDEARRAVTVIAVGHRRDVYRRR